VTSFTNGKIIAAKRTFAVMTCHTALPAASSVMIERFRRSHLTTLWHSRSNLMTFHAWLFLVLRVTETDAKSLSELRRARVTAQLVAGAARRNVTTR
jgi:hypothetical protein